MRQRVGVRVRRQLRVERGVEHGDVRDRREHLARRADAGEVDRVVERREHRALLDDRLDACRRSGSATISCSPPWTTRWPTAPSAPGSGSGPPARVEVREDRAQRARRRSSRRPRSLPSSWTCTRLGCPHALGPADGEPRLGVHLVEVVLDRRGADVDDEDLHGPRMLADRARSVADGAAAAGIVNRDLRAPAASAGVVTTRTCQAWAQARSRAGQGGFQAARRGASRRATRGQETGRAEPFRATLSCSFQTRPHES